MNVKAFTPEGFVYALLIGLTLSTGRITAEESKFEAAFRKAGELIEQDQWEGAIEYLGRSDRSLPETAKLRTWRLSLAQQEGYPCQGCVIGDRYLYLLTPRPPRNNEKPVPTVVPDDRPVLNDGPSRYDFHTFVTCVDGKTGEKLWTRRFAGRFSFAVGAKDDLYGWRESLFQLDARSGKVRHEQEFPQDAQPVEALVIDGKFCFSHRFSWQTRRQTHLDTQISVYNPESRSVVRIEAIRAQRMAPDESKILAVDRESLGAVGIDGKGRWDYRAGSMLSGGPVWFDQDVIALTGTRYDRGVLARLDGDTGNVLWQFPLRRGVHPAEIGGLVGNPHWDAFAILKGPKKQYVAALGADERIHILDEKTGEQEATLLPGAPYLTFPAIIDEALIVALQKEVMAIPLDVVFDGLPVTEADVIQLKAECLNRLGRRADALAEVDRLISLDPLRAEAWKLRADLCAALDRPFEEIAARCRFLELTGREESQRLRDRWGLLKRFATGSDITANLAVLSGRQTTPKVEWGDRVYAGTQGGAVYVIDSQALRIVAKSQFPSSVRQLTPPSQLTVRLGANGFGKMGLAEIEAPGEEQTERLPSEFTKYNGYDGFAVQWRGAWYRPLKGGHIRVQDGNEMHEYKTALKGITSWELWLSPTRVLGYGTGGVYELDEHLCPVRKLIEANEVAALASVRETLGIVTFAEPNRPTLQVWMEDGSRKLREVVLQPPTPETEPVDSLQVLGDGYLFSGSELAWVPAGERETLWRFGVNADIGPVVPRIPYRHVSFYGTPLRVGGRMFVPCRDGGIYVFDIDRIMAG